MLISGSIPFVNEQFGKLQIQYYFYNRPSQALDKIAFWKHSIQHNYACKMWGATNFSTLYTSTLPHLYPKFTSLRHCVHNSMDNLLKSDWKVHETVLTLPSTSVLPIVHVNAYIRYSTDLSSLGMGNQKLTPAELCQLFGRKHGSTSIEGLVL